MKLEAILDRVRVTRSVIFMKESDSREIDREVRVKGLGSLCLTVRLNLVLEIVYDAILKPFVAYAQI